MLIVTYPGAVLLFFFSSRRRHTRYIGDWSSDVCSSDLIKAEPLFDSRHDSTHGGVQAIAERSGADDDGRETERATRLMIEQNAIDPAHLASVAIDDLRVQDRKSGV